MKAFTFGITGGSPYDGEIVVVAGRKDSAKREARRELKRMNNGTNRYSFNDEEVTVTEIKSHRLSTSTTERYNGVGIRRHTHGQHHPRCNEADAQRLPTTDHVQDSHPSVRVARL